MTPTICIVGSHNSGKTSFLERLIPELKRRGYRVGTIKHDIHSFEMDREGKDTWRHKQAGSTTVAISSPSQFAFITHFDEEMSLGEIVLRFFRDVDIVLAEGFKQSPYPKIEVFRKDLGDKPLLSAKDNLIAIVSDDTFDTTLPTFATSDSQGVADMLERQYLASHSPSPITILLDGQMIPMNDFVKNVVMKTVEGLCSALRGWENPREILLSIRRS